MESSRKSKKFRSLWLLVPIGILLAVVGIRGPYLFPVSLALGPCFPDIVSPTTYLGFFEEKASPMRTLNVSVATTDVQVCYGSPSARDRAIFESVGEGVADSSDAESSRNVLVPNGRLWRLGANEPTRLFTNGPIMFGALRLEPGRYAIYAIPGNNTWQVFATRSINHWGNQISGSVRAKEVGSTIAEVESTGDYHEAFSIQGQSVITDSTALEIKWESTRVIIPIRALRESGGQ